MKKEGKRKSIVCKKCGRKFSTKPDYNNKYPSICKDCSPILVG